MNNQLKIEEIHKELDLIQSCINRMASNSFMIKGWAITIYAVVLALLSEKINILLLCTVMTTVTWAFWYLDAFFLQTEKQFRKMYSWVLDERPKENRELLYELNPFKFKGKITEVDSIRSVMFSKTLKLFYGIPLIILVVIMLVNVIPIICNVYKCYCSF